MPEKRKRKSPVARTLVKNGCAALMAAIEIHNKPIFDYRYEVCTLLVVNAWELVIKALIYKRLPKVKIEEDGQPLPFKKCLGILEGHFSGTDKQTFLPIKESLESLYKYRNSIAHFHSEELDVILFSLLRASVIDFAHFVKIHFQCDVCSGPTVLLPIHVSGDFNPVEFLIKRPTESQASQEVRDFINGLLESCERLQAAGVNESIFSTWTMELLSAKKASNADVLAARANTAVDSTPVSVLNALDKEIKISNSPSATLVRMEEKDWTKTHPLDYKKVVEEARSRFEDFKINSDFHALMAALKSQPNFCHQHPHNPKKPGGKCTPMFSPLVLDELAKHYAPMIDKAKFALVKGV